MISFFSDLQISPTSFLLGFLSGLLFAWIFSRLILLLPKVISKLRNNLGHVRENFSNSAEVRLRNDVYAFTQKQHLAAPMFSLDEIAVQPRVLTPIIQTPVSITHAFTDCVSLSVPYVPDWPELAAVYNASTMSLIEALQGGTNIILAGHPGYGKSVALAWLAARLSQDEKGLGKLTGFLPFYVHVTDIPDIFTQDGINIEKTNEDEPSQTKTPSGLPSGSVKSAEEVIDLIIRAISTYVSPSTSSRLSNLLRTSLNNQRAILLIDRVDELPPKQSRTVVEYLRLLVQKYPKLRIIIAMSYDDLAGIPTLGFSLLGLAAWNDNERSIYVQQWGEQWAKWITPLIKTHSKQVYKYFLKSWLSSDNELLTPLEFTLKVWAAFSGDILGTDGSSAIEVYLRRITADHAEARQVLEQFALQLLLENEIAAKPKPMQKFLRNYSPEIAELDKSIDQDDSPSTESITQSTDVNFSHLESIANNGFLINYPGSRYGFTHPIFFGYLAGKALSESKFISQTQRQPSWVGKNWALYYLSSYGDVSPIIQSYLQEDDILHTNHLLISRWLQVAPKNCTWRTSILRTLTSVLQKERESASLSAKIIAALAFAGDAGVSIYFKQLIKSEHPILKPLAALGCGIIGDNNSVDDLNQMLQEQSPASIRTASLALAAIGDKRALEILASNLLNGSELMRRYAAEALSNNQQEGYPALRDGSTMEDLQVRRSVVFGLIRIDQPWARKIIENLQLEDGEWVVRTAAIQVFDELNNKYNYAPTPLPDLTETPWLADYATRMGTTIAPGKPAEELVIKALNNGTTEEQLFAIDYLRNKCYPRSVDLLYNTYQNSTGELRDAIYHVLWLMAISGIRLPLLFEEA